MTDSSINPCEVFSHPTLSCIIMKWAGYPSSDKFREGTERMLQLLKKKKFNKVIADVRELKLISSEDQEWVLNTFLPIASKDGFRVVAFINSDDYNARNSIENIVYRINLRNMDFGFFNTMEAAENWIQSIEFRSPGFEVTFDEEADFIVTKWFGRIDTNEFKDGLKSMSEFIIKKKCCNAIIDLENVSYSVDLEIHAWIKEAFLPLIISQGLKKCAFINPGIYNTLSIYNIMAAQPSNLLEIEIFNSLKSATEWISKGVRE